MSEHTKPVANPDEQAKTTKPEGIDLTEKELDQVAGGAGTVTGTLSVTKTDASSVDLFSKR